ncbi:WD40 repeat protein [Kordia periserrulae]|uniref:WD40 repeat protein n=1 Tax=Kordia periserrulae TaxID=701523 RepID=A0A2T6BXX8_9FLAO|nr:PD40 domain-containing protein [Kordia periserrulae]PTX60886.1 WD40 repeat protein [Kordia periserrulae]
MKNILVIFTFLLVIFSCQTAQKEEFLFSSNRTGNSDIYLMDVATGETTQLTNSANEEWGPTWITKNTISFLRQEKDQITRVELNLDTKKETAIAHPENCVLDDKNMLYAANGTLQLYLCKSDVFLFDTTTKETTNLTESLQGFSNYPSWSFDGRHVIFTNNSSGTNDIYKVNVQTREIKKLTDYSSNDERGELSPDANYLVFSSDKFQPKNQDILLMNLKTGTLENITNSKGNELIARWSADGKQVYYGSNTDGNWELYRYSLKDKSTKRLTNTDAFDGDPRVFKN